VSNAGEGRAEPAEAAVQYLKVAWHHDFVDEPVLIYSELGPDRYERRKIDIYRDGRQDYADQTRPTGTTRLGESPIPTTSEIAALDEFTPYEITPDEFEAVWRATVRIHGDVAAGSCHDR
jgi:hypothetical protein